MRRNTTPLLPPTPSATWIRDNIDKLLPHSRARTCSALQQESCVCGARVPTHGRKKSFISNSETPRGPAAPPPLVERASEANYMIFARGQLVCPASRFSTEDRMKRRTFLTGMLAGAGASVIAAFVSPSRAVTRFAPIEPEENASASKPEAAIATPEDLERAKIEDARWWRRRWWRRRRRWWGWRRRRWWRRHRRRWWR